MPTRVLLTIDTELTWRHHRGDGCWRANLERSYHAAGVGVPYQLEVLAAHDLKACFFVDPMPALLFGIEPVKAMVEPILAAGQEVQLHLHPFWANLADGDHVGTDFELASYDAQRQVELVGIARELLMQAGAPEPVAFRAGSYAANADTIAALTAHGLRYDSSHDRGHHPRSSFLPLHAGQVAPTRIGDVVEIPVSQIEEVQGQFRHLQICALSFAELRAALRYAVRNHHPVATIVSHSFELATRDGMRPNHMLQNRFLALCRLLAAERERMPTDWFASLGDVPLDADIMPAPGAALRRTRRVVEQLWSGARYERPVESLTATGGGGIAGLEVLMPYVG